MKCFPNALLSENILSLCWNFHQEEDIATRGGRAPTCKDLHALPSFSILKSLRSPSKAAELCSDFWVKDKTKLQSEVPQARTLIILWSLVLHVLM